MSSEHYLLQWKGRQSGPFSLATIREKLDSGEISRMHQVEVNSRWIFLDEFLEARRRDEIELQSQEATKRREEAAQREWQMKRDFDRKIAAERERQSELEARLARVETSPLRLEKAQEPQSSTAPPDYPPQMGGYQPQRVDYRPRTSGLAIAALIMGICNFIPFLNAVTWILAIIFGHVSLSQMKRDPTLEGRGMAIAGLMITYILLGVGMAYIIATFILISTRS